MWRPPASKTWDFNGVESEWGTEQESREEGRGMGHEWDVSETEDAGG